MISDDEETPAELPAQRPEDPDQLPEWASEAESWLKELFPEAKHRPMEPGTARIIIPMRFKESAPPPPPEPLRGPRVQEFEPSEEGGTPRGKCPFCGWESWIGTVDEWCPHVVAVTGGYITDTWPGVDWLADVYELGRLADELGDAFYDRANPPAEIEADFRGAFYGWDWVVDAPELRGVSAVIDECMSEWEYTNWFHPDPAYRDGIRTRARKVLEWLKAQT